MMAVLWLQQDDRRCFFLIENSSCAKHKPKKQERERGGGSNATRVSQHVAAIFDSGWSFSNVFAAVNRFSFKRTPRANR